MAANTHTSPAVELFLKSWRLYQEIIEHNYMFHEQISLAAKEALEEFASNKRLRIVDLGCGDASMVLPLLSPKFIASYAGCDLSQPALAIAKPKLSEQGISHRLYCDDMRQFISNESDNNADVLIASYAIHHLNAIDKQHLIREIFRVLAPGGMFILIDIFREPGEDRAAYIRNYMSAVRQRWLNLSAESQSLVINHATEYDFPELPDFYQAYCKKAGLTAGQRLAKHTWHEAWVFTKPIDA